MLPHPVASPPPLAFNLSRRRRRDDISSTAGRVASPRCLSRRSALARNCKFRLRVGRQFSDGSCTWPLQFPGMAPTAVPGAETGRPAGQAGRQDARPRPALSGEGLPPNATTGILRGRATARRPGPANGRARSCSRRPHPAGSPRGRAPAAAARRRSAGRRAGARPGARSRSAAAAGSGAPRPWPAAAEPWSPGTLEPRNFHVKHATSVPPCATVTGKGRRQTTKLFQKLPAWT